MSNKPITKVCCLTHEIAHKFADAVSQWAERNNLCIDCMLELSKQHVRAYADLVRVEREAERAEKVQAVLQEISNDIKQLPREYYAEKTDEESAIIARRKGQIH